MQIITRKQWGAVHEDGFGTAPLPADELWLHHSVTIAPDLVPPYDDEYAAMRTLERIGEQRFGRGISYTFAAMPTGRIYEGHGIGRKGAHTGGRNSIARAIVLVGNSDTNDVTDAQIEQVAQLVVHGYRQGWWKRPRLNGGHQQAPGAATGCPGRFGMRAIPLINARAAAILAGSEQPEEDDDLTPAEQQMLKDIKAEIMAARRQDLIVLNGRAARIEAALAKLADEVAKLKDHA